MKNKKLLLIGIDAADWQLIDEISKTHDLRFFNRLKQNGATGQLASLNPMLSPMLWTSIATGKRPYAHGITGFTEFDEENQKAIPIKASRRKVKAVWNILNEAGLKTNLINWWPSYPVESLNGVMVSNATYASGADDLQTIHPLHFQEKLKEWNVKSEEVTAELIQAFVPNAHEIPKEQLQEVVHPLAALIQKTASVHNHATWLLEHTEWDFQAVYYEVLDQAGHLAMKYHPPQMEGVDDQKFKWYKNIIAAVYQWVDMMLERLVELAPTADILIVSDHGFEGQNKRLLNLPDVPAAPALEHRAYGVIGALGQNFASAEALYGYSLLDITPSILHYFDLPVGQDMHGKVMTAVFKEKKAVGELPSWEVTGNKPIFIEGAHADEELLKQLEALGYWKAAESNLAQHINAELTYNLAVSLLDGGEIEEAVNCAFKAYQKYGEFRFALLFLQLWVQQARFAAFHNFVDGLPEQEKLNPALRFMEAKAALFQGETKKALTAFLKLEEDGLVSSMLYAEMGRAAQMAQQVTAAKSYYQKGLALDADDIKCIQGVAACMLGQGEPQQAIEFLDQALKLRFYQPQTHYLFAVALAKLNKIQEAFAALQVCLKQAPKHKQAKAFMDKLQGAKTQKEPIYIVTGFPRSGTSMMMQMLRSGGLHVFSDDKRKADTHNPKGYFELEQVKTLGQSAEWLNKAEGKVIKVVLPLLRYLPADLNYKLIWMERPLQEIVLSQELMKGRDREDVLYAFPFDLALKMQEEEKRIKTFLEQLPHAQVLSIKYHDCIKASSKVLKQIANFVEVDFDTEKAFSAIDSSLLRNNLGG